MGRTEIESVLSKDEYRTTKRIITDMELRGIAVNSRSLQHSLTRMVRGGLVERRLISVCCGPFTFGYRLI